MNLNRLLRNPGKYGHGYKMEARKLRFNSYLYEIVNASCELAVYTGQVCECSYRKLNQAASLFSSKGNRGEIVF